MFPNTQVNFETTPDIVATNIEYAVLVSLYWWNNLSARGGSVNKYAKGVTKKHLYNVSWCVNGRAK